MFKHLYNRTPNIIDESIYKKYSVLVPYIKENDSILFEIRSEKLTHQPSEICFPGGKIEKGETGLDAAVRETCEELSITKDQIDIKFPLDTLITAYYTIVYPYFCELNNYNYTFSKDEVHDIFTVPIDFFLKTKPLISYNCVITKPKDESFPYHLIQNGKDYKWGISKYPVLFYEYEGKIIWGMTAKFIKNLIELVNYPAPRGGASV